MSDTTEQILKRIVQSLTSHMDELQTIHDGMEADPDEGNDEQLPAIQAAIDGLEGARDSLVGLSDGDGDE
jgi:hypothetical protein